MPQALHTLKAASVALMGLSLIIYTNAFAMTKEETRVEIRLHELSTPEGVATVYYRLVETAHKSCAEGPAPWLLDLDIRTKCAAIMLDDFITTADHDALSDYHETTQN